MLETLAACLLFTNSVFAPPQAELTAKLYGINYPISALGGCANQADCETYCQNPANKPACDLFAASVGLMTAPITSSPGVTPMTNYFNQDPELVCRQSANCSWTGSACRCTFPTPLPLPTTVYTNTGSTTSTLVSPTPFTGLPQPTSYFCSGGRVWTGSSCICPEGQVWNGSYCYSQTTICSPPTVGCGIDKIWDSALCTCRLISSGTSNTPTPTSTSTTIITPTLTTCAPPTNGCGLNAYWDQSRCTCQLSSSGSTQDSCLISGCVWTGTACSCPMVQGTESEALAGVFPVAELGNCSDCISCSNYCNQSANKSLCLAYLKSKGWTGREPEVVQSVLANTSASLGCNSAESCREYCQDPVNFARCQQFAQNQGVASRVQIVPAPRVVTKFSSTVTDRQQIEVKAVPGGFVDIYLQSADQPQNTIFVGRAKTNDEGRISYPWDTVNYPNGNFKLIAKTVYGGKESNVADFSEVVINHPPGKAGETTNEVVWPQGFNPGAVPVDKKQARLSKVRSDVGEDGTARAIVFSGKAQPNSLVSVLIFSNPIVVTVRADANGTWTYELQKPLTPGRHVAYAAVTSSTGARVRSEVANFVISPVAAAEDESDGSLVVASARNNTAINRYFIAALVISGAGMLILLVMVTIKMRRAANITL